jgi:hypothetical protein
MTLAQPGLAPPRVFRAAAQAYITRTGRKFGSRSTAMSGLMSPRSLRAGATPAPAAQVAFHAEERALLRRVNLRALSAIEQMYAYWGSDRA